MRSTFADDSALGLNFQFVEANMAVINVYVWQVGPTSPSQLNCLQNKCII